MSSSKVSVVVHNMSKSPIFLKKGYGWHRWCWPPQCHHWSSPLRWKSLWGAEATCEAISVSAQQEKLLEKLKLDGLSHWTPSNTAAAWDLILAYHDIFALEGNKLGCTSAIEHEIRIMDSEPFKEWFRHIPPLLLEEVHTSLQDMLDMGVICPSQSLWCNMVVLVTKKDGMLQFSADFHRLNAYTKKDLYPLPPIQEALESMVGATHFSIMDFKSRF